jgi:hypothetical protein
VQISLRYFPWGNSRDYPNLGHLQKGDRPCILHRNDGLQGHVHTVVDIGGGVPIGAEQAIALERVCQNELSPRGRG